MLQLTLEGPDPIDLVLSDPSDDVRDHRIKLIQKARSQQEALAATLMRFLTEHCDEEQHQEKLAVVSEHVRKLDQRTNNYELMMASRAKLGALKYVKLCLPHVGRL